MTTQTSDEYVIPGKSQGLRGVLAHRYLLSLIVGKEIRVRYRGSYLGMLWSYAKPATQFLVFFLVIGHFMGMGRAIPNYVIYMFSGIILINFVNEIIGQGSRSIVYNKDLVKKIYLPRELFPVAVLRVAIVHFLPQILILLLGTLLFSWRPGITNLLAAFAGFGIIAIFSLGIALLSSALNVLFRDTENFVDLLLMIATWASPILYTVHMVSDVFSGKLEFLWYLYLLNPITIGTELFHYAFWVPTLDAASSINAGLPHLGIWTVIAFAVSIITLLFGERVFRRIDPRFAQEL
ncbi:MAG: ABC transporter permease [Arcanobacterium sp.]|nr:ABC transporter permease [Arcanobacterium sp.]